MVRGAYFRPTTVVIAAQDCAQSGIDHLAFGPDEDVWSSIHLAKTELRASFTTKLKTTVVWTKHL